MGKNSIKTWAKRLGFWGVMFFLLKGLLWLAIPALIAFYAITIALGVAAGIVGGIAPWALLLFLAPAAHFAWQIKTLDIADPGNCLKIFRSNRQAGLLMLAPLLLAAILGRT